MDADLLPTTALHDPLLPSLFLGDFHSGKNSGSDLTKLLTDCIAAFKDNAQYRDASDFSRLGFLYISKAFFWKCCTGRFVLAQSLLYVWYATFLEAKEKLFDAHMVYQMGISRNAKPVKWVEKAHAVFLARMSRIASLAQKNGNNESVHSGSLINPWSSSTMKDLLKKVNQLTKYEGYHSTTKAYSGKVALSSLKSSSRNKTVEIGQLIMFTAHTVRRMKYQITGCAGQGGFAQIYKAYVNCNPEDVVALKIQKPAFPWEFYMYYCIINLINGSQARKSSFGFAHRMHLYPDCSILVSYYLASGTLQVRCNKLERTENWTLLMIFYSLSAFHLPLNGLTKAGSRDRTDFTEEEFCERSGPWLEQGLCLVDWGRGIDLHLFPDNVEFTGDCRPSRFRCVEMQENRPWTYQVDTYGLCVVVHTMLHNSYMEIDKKPSPEVDASICPSHLLKASLLSLYFDDFDFNSCPSTGLRYWNGELWRNIFTKTANSSPGCNNKKLLWDLRKSFQDYMCSDPQLIKKLSDLLVKQRASLCSA
ncbi:mitotic checkpoint serine/threonine-protein kinase BUB1 [Pyrus ussuriensis x Pyrus communis]|uniref:Mitotic checkpoint serine/threonine-protein kinase BUB1 n=1 Tax=Pyrus ussuriensis x Pyrus communis TaxID=2448454 RepID=A0A5N5GBM5_9ROSA|nr:mitotic checkpoint serine/threonine-protein kinase BUB1 [Pyrus ussuriensis x Pyrus communis]